MTTIHEPDYRRLRMYLMSRIEGEGQRQKNMEMTANQSLG